MLCVLSNIKRLFFQYLNSVWERIIDENKATLVFDNDKLTLIVTSGNGLHKIVDSVDLKVEDPMLEQNMRRIGDRVLTFFGGKVDLVLPPGSVGFFKRHLLNTRSIDKACKQLGNELGWEADKYFMDVVVCNILPNGVPEIEIAVVSREIMANCIGYIRCWGMKEKGCFAAEHYKDCKYVPEFRCAHADDTSALDVLGEMRRGFALTLVIIMCLGVFRGVFWYYDEMMYSGTNKLASASLTETDINRQSMFNSMKIDLSSEEA